MMKMAEAAAMGKELPKRTTPLVTSEEDAAKLSLHKFRPQRPMAPDLAHQYLALKNPELDSKQRRQLRNKLSARSFRERRKEYIDSIEQELRRIVGENAAQKRELEAVREERDALKREVEGLRGRMVGLKIEEKEGDDMELDDGNIGNLSTFSRENLKQEGHALTVRSALMPDFAHVFASMEDGALPGVREFLREHDEIEVLKGLQGDRSMPHASRAEVSGKEAVEWVMKTFDAIRNMAFPESYCVKHAGGVDEVDFDDTETLFGEDGSDLQAVSVGASDQEVYFDNDSDDESLNGEAEDMDDGLGPIERLMMALNMSQSPAWK
ncbi:hypothetical protein BC830DRAFT_549695 [Chytriomyces sp. MP71]|nr:hypothetical protein BC830DRAFT_549695 [Chytriomyces sp. MP71]